jgi:hypothetical protein
MATTLGDPGDEEPRLTPEQLETIRKAISDPAYLRQFKIAENSFNSLNKQIVSTFVTGIAPTLQKFREQQRQMATSIAPMMAAQVRMDLVLRPILNQARTFQSEFAKQLGVSLVAREGIQAQIQRLVVSSEFTEAMRRVRELSQVDLEIPNEDGLDRLAELVESGAIDQETIDYAEEAVAENAELSEAIDHAVEEFIQRRPLVPRKIVRAMIVTWVWLMYGGALFVIAVATTPIAAALPGAVGAPGPIDVAKRAGSEFDKRFPPEDLPEESVDG